MSSIKPCHGGSEIDCAEEVSSPFVIASGDGAELLESRKKVLNQVPRLVQGLIVFPWGGSVGFGGNDDDLARLVQRLDYPVISIKGLIGNDGIRLNTREQDIGALQIMCLSWGEMKPYWVTQRITGGVDFGGQASL